MCLRGKLFLSGLIAMDFMDQLLGLNGWDEVVQAKTDFHIHTNWTDGEHSVQQMYEAANAVGLDAILYSEHVRANSGSWYPEFVREVKSLPRKTCHAFAGAETKILNFAGELDCPREVFHHADAIMGVVHRFPGETDTALKTQDKGLYSEAVDLEFELSKIIMRTGLVQILGHPMGMSIRRFGLSPERSIFEELAALAAETGVCFEINSRYHADPIGLVEICCNAGAPISLGSNAHSIDEVGDLTRILKNVE